MDTSPRPAFPTCFFEQDPGLPLVRRVAAEFVGTLLLTMAVVCAALAAGRMFAGLPGLALVVTAFVASSALVSLILAFGNASGGHFNPLITGLQWLGGERALRCTLAYVAAQFAGAAVGALLANLLSQVWAPPANRVAVNATLALSEVIATAGLMIVIFGCSRSGRAATGPFASGGWLFASILAMPSSCYANPAITVAAIVACGPVSLSLKTALVYVPAQVGGAIIAFAVVSIVYPLARAAERGRAVDRIRGDD
jgi:glycerol uptake facilitator-like aquaporin